MDDAGESVIAPTSRVVLTLEAAQALAHMLSRVLNRAKQVAQSHAEPDEPAMKPKRTDA
jgi:hypothetical protein